MPKKKFTEQEIEDTVSEIHDFLKNIKLDCKENFEINLLKKCWPEANPRYIENQKTELKNLKAYEVLIKESGNSYIHFQLLKSFIADWMDLKPENTPSILCRWISGYLKGEIVSPKQNGGKPKEYQKRLWLAVATFMVIDKGFPKGRGDANYSEGNAFSIVQKAANQAGWKEVTYTTVRDYFKQMKHLS